MRTKTLLSSATPETAQAAIKQAIDGNWTIDAIKRHGSPAVLEALGQDKAQNRVATPAKTPKARKPRPQANFAKATPASITLTLTPKRGGESETLTLTGQQGIVGARKALQVRFTSPFAVSMPQALFDTLKQGVRRLVFVPNRGMCWAQI